MITVISSTNRPESMTALVAETFCNMLKSKGSETKFYSLKDLPPTFLHSEMYSTADVSMSEVIAEFIVPTNKFVFIIPEYNGSYPGILKLFIDAIHPKYFREKKAAIIGISDGHSGNQRGQDHLTGVLNYLKMNVHFFQPKLSSIDKLVVNQEITDPRALKLLNDLADYIIAF